MTASGGPADGTGNAIGPPEARRADDRRPGLLVNHAHDRPHLLGPQAVAEFLDGLDLLDADAAAVRLFGPGRFPGGCPCFFPCGGLAHNPALPSPLPQDSP